MRKLSRFLTIAGGLLAAFFVFNKPISADSAGETWTPDYALVLGIERSLNLPEDADEIGEYFRIYWGANQGGEKIVRAMFLRVSSFRTTLEEYGFDPDGDRVAIISNSRRMFDVDDGGCSVIKLRWRVSDREPLSFHCNGYA